MPSLVVAAPIQIVTNTNDAGVGSLRQAIIDVDTGGEIVFQIPLSGIISANAPLVINKSMSINGPGENSLTIMSGGAIDQVIIISDTNPTRSRVQISNLTVHGGMSTFSGILNLENLTINNLTVTGSSDGITNSGQNSVGAILEINNSSLTGNSQAGVFVSGGLENEAPGGHVIINDSLISNNGVFGIFNFAPQHEFAQGSKVVVNNTTISGNSTGIINNGGNSATNTIGSTTEINNSTITESSIVNAIGGDGILNIGGAAEGATGGIVIIRNSTISNNMGSAIVAEGAQVQNSTGSITKISSSTLSGNKFALIYLIPEPGMDPVFEVKNSILANSTNNFPLNCAPNTITLTSLGLNISTDDSCPGFVEVASHELDLGPLQNNGGPTETQALTPSSSAIGVVNDCSFINGELVLTDQRGFLRPQRNCDAGAFELGGVSPIPIDIPALTNWGTILAMSVFIFVLGYYRRKSKVLS